MSANATKSCTEDGRDRVALFGGEGGRMAAGVGAAAAAHAAVAGVAVHESKQHQIYLGELEALVDIVHLEGHISPIEREARCVHSNAGSVHARDS